MISIFNGNMRGTGTSQSPATYVQIHHSILPHLKNFSASEWVVFTALAMHMDGNGYCFPSIGSLSTITGLSIPTIRRAIDGLEAVTVNGVRVLAVRYRHDKTGRQTSNGYVLFPDADPAKFDGEEGIKTDTPEGIKIDTPITLNKKHIEQESERTVIKKPKSMPKLPGLDDPGRAIYEAYRSVIFPELDASDFTLGEWTGVRHIVYQMHGRGIDPYMVERAAKTLVTKWNGKRDIVTMNALWKHWSAATTGTPTVTPQSTTGKGPRTMQDVAASAIDVFRKVTGTSE